MKKFWEKLSKYKSVLPAIAVFVLIFAFTPTHYAKAWPWDAILTILKGLPGLIVFGLPLGIMFIGVFISFIFYAMAASILGVVVSDSFVNYSLTQAGGNPIIAAGWGITSNLANMVFVIILAFIAISTILRLENYGMKKLLPKFILAVLMINFSLVIMGAIVDIANVIQYDFFGTNAGIGQGLVNQFENFLGVVPVLQEVLHLDMGSVIMKLLEICDSFNDILNAFVTCAAMIIFGFVGGFVILLYVIIFIIRIIALWFLAILAPIAWACWVLPQTKKHWDDWWKQFIQWAFVGAYAGFFLYLTQKLINVMAPGSPESLEFSEVNAVNSSASTAGFVGNFVSTIVNNMMSLIALIAFMIIGLMLSIKASSGTPQMILGAGTKIGKSLGKAGASWARKSGPVSATEGAIRKRMESVPGLNRLGPFKKGSWEVQKDARVKAAAKSIESVPDTKEGNAALWARANQIGTSDSDAIAYLQTLADRNALPDDPTDQVNQNKLHGLLRRTGDKGLNKKAVIKSRPDLAEHLIHTYKDPITGTERPVRNRAEAIKVGMANLNPNDYTKSVISLMDDDVVAQLAQDGRRIKQMGRNLEPEKKKLFKERCDTIMTNQGPGTIWSRLTRKEKESLVATNAMFAEDPNWA